jgi:hypothetical protein
LISNVCRSHYSKCWLVTAHGEYARGVVRLLFH